MLVLRTAAQLRGTTCACMGPPLIFFKVHLVKWPLILILIIAVLWVNMFHGQSTLELGRAKHSGHIADVVADTMISHLLFAEQGRILFPLRLDLRLEPLDLLFNFVACPGTALGCGTLSGRLRMLQFLLHLLWFLIEIFKRWLSLCQLCSCLFIHGLAWLELVLKIFRFLLTWSDVCFESSESFTAF